MIINSVMDLEDALEYWHTHDTGVHIYEFIGLTPQQYIDSVAGYLSDEDILAILRSKNKKRKLYRIKPVAEVKNKSKEDVIILPKYLVQKIIKELNKTKKGKILNFLIKKVKQEIPSAKADG